jgi:hypothetical protein
LPHGHVLAALATAQRSNFEDLLPRRAPQRRRYLALAMVVARLLDPAAKLATARMLDPATAIHSLGEVLGLGSVTARELYATLDWLGSEQDFIEAALARRHLRGGALLLYDVTSTYLEGRCCELAQRGYSRDHRRDRPQIVIGLICAVDGCPIAVEVFAALLSNSGPECWRILAHPLSLNLRSPWFCRGTRSGLERQSGIVRAAASGA